MRKRYLSGPLEKLLDFSPLVGILGHRQVGKTTLLEEIGTAYHVLDVDPSRSEAQSDPARFLRMNSGTRVALDEVQLVPDLFPALKEWVRKHRKPGQFILSGSVRFTSRDAIRESLTGRIMYQELLPFSVAELAQEPLADFCLRALEARDLSDLARRSHYLPSRVRKAHALMEKYLVHGGLPGICFIRDRKLREQKIEEQLLTILDRDVRLVKKIQVPFSDIRRLLQVLAQGQGSPVDYTHLGRETGLSLPTLKKLLYAFEAVFLLRTVLTEGSTRGSTFYFEDVAEARTLARQELPYSTRVEQFLFCDLRTQFQYRLGMNIRVFQYLTRGGARVPLCFEGEKGVLGIISIDSMKAASSVSGTIRSFLSTYGNGKLLLLHPEVSEPELIQPRVLLAPIGHVIL